MEVDFVALSFARQKSDLEELRRVLKKLGSTAQIVAKIEDQSAVRQIDEMIDTADVVMIARGDLGIECPDGRAADHPAQDREALPPDR